MKFTKIASIFFIFMTISIEIVKVSSSSALLHENQVSEESAGGRHNKQEQEHAHEVHCSRERSRVASKIIEQYLMPFVEQENYQLSSKCRLHPDNNIFRDQEEHKIYIDINEWRCGYCKKSFRAEKFLDQHFDNRHYNLLNVSHGKCLADLCGALHCDAVMNTKISKTKCNPAAAGRNRHLCESLADSCFPINGGPSASRLREGKKYALYGCRSTDLGATSCVLSFCLFGTKRYEESKSRASAHYKSGTESKTIMIGIVHVFQ
ncbi:zinc finger protein [Senna tora]|uniref:Zinc finger protein n=1 Tax=Senna tora TaxID=362788 RepID=A0A834SLB6_9FABA|nr:zinc finger protein [Senna tora]